MESLKHNGRRVEVVETLKGSKREHSAKPLHAEYRRRRHEPAFVAGIGNDFVNLSIRAGTMRGQKQEVEPEGVFHSGGRQACWEWCLGWKTDLHGQPWGFGM